MARSGAYEPLISRTDGTVQQVPESLSVRGIRIVFRELEYLLPSNTERGKTATVLHSMSGYFNAGEMTTIMGPSGCGKSMMMDVLAGRRTSGKLNGSITYAGTRPTQMFLRRITGYVEQFGTLIENLTVYEMLMYTAELKRPLTESYESKKRAVNNLIAKLALEKCRETKIGDPQLDRGISGGQAKRVNVGIALITNPRVLYMDEPISGLDSYTSNEVMEMVKKLVNEGITLIATLHSPTPFVFNLFDKVCLLLRGNVVYFGRRDRAISFFEPITPSDVISADSDAEWLTDVIVKADAAGKAEEFADYYEKSAKKQEVLDSLAATEDEPLLDQDIVDELSSGKATVTPSWFAIKTYLKYRTLKNYLDASFWTTRVSDKIVLVVLLASVYWGLGNDFEANNFTNIASIFVCWSAFSAFGASVYIPTLFIDRQLFYREHRDGLYRVVTYFFVKLIEEMIVVTLFGLLCSLVVWYTVDLQGNFGLFYLVFLGNFYCGLALAFLFSALAPNIDAAVGGMATYLTTVVLYCGFYIRSDDMPSYLIWYSKISFIKYSFGAYVINHFNVEEGKNLELQAGEDPTDTVPVLQYYGLDDVDKYGYTGYIFLFALCYAFLAFLCMQYIRHEKR